VIYYFFFFFFFSTGNFRSWTKEQCVKWVEANKIFDDRDDLEIFAKMKYRGEDFDKISVSILKEDGLAAGPAMRLFNAMQELIKSKDERTYIIYLLPRTCGVLI
jgi:hypothetical protein